MNKTEENKSEKILKLIETAYKLALASAATEDAKKGIDNFYHVHLNSLNYQIPSILKEDSNNVTNNTREEV